MKHLKFGHMIIEKNGRNCTCGLKGCFEAYASMRALKEKIKCKFGMEDITGEKFYEIVKSKEAKEIVNEFLDDLCVGLINLVNIFEPEAICIGGSFAHFEDLLLKPLTDRMNKSKSFNSSVPDIVIAKMQNDAGMIGATIM